VDDAAGRAAAAAEAPAQESTAQERTERQAPAPAAAVAAEQADVEPVRPRRRSRRASAPTARPGEAEVTAGRAAAAEGARHEAKTVAQRAPEEPSRRAPTVVGVGVKAEDLTSGRPADRG
jgi:ribonuclease E